MIFSDKPRMLLELVPVTLALALLAWLFYFYAQHTEILRSARLTDCTNSVLNFQLKVPKGRSFRFVLGTPGGRKGAGVLPGPFSGNIRISRGVDLVAKFKIGSDLAEGCNWVQEADLPVGYALTGPSNTNCPKLQKLIHPLSDYDVEVVFDQPPPTTTTIWLCWQQEYKDRGK